MSLMALGQRLQCRNTGCLQHLGLVDDGFLEVIYKHLSITVEAPAKIRVACPNCGFVSHYHLTSTPKGGKEE